tara:strand:- start:408 stop:521 length:114 start_codon:yes stop_codon:yes gene_type:complete
MMRRIHIEVSFLDVLRSPKLRREEEERRRRRRKRIRT